MGQKAKLSRKYRRRRNLILLSAVLVGLLALREYFDPFLVLFISDVLIPKPEPFEVALTDSLSVRLYTDTRPHIGKIDALQKGLILRHNDKSLIEEGYGFGLPIIQVGDLAYQARHASIEKHQTGDEITLIKSYTIDTADRWSRFLRVKYKSVPPLGTVTCRYTIRSPDTISITVDFQGLDTPWARAYLMNEQGARAFPFYQNSRGEIRHGDDLGIWHAEKDSFGCWLTSEMDLRFCVETEPEQRRFIGRERYNQYNWVGIYTLSWAGIDIEIDPPVNQYRYVIRIEAVE